MNTNLSYVYCVLKKNTINSISNNSIDNELVYVTKFKDTEMNYIKIIHGYCVTSNLNRAYRTWDSNPEITADRLSKKFETEIFYISYAAAQNLGIPNEIMNS